VVWEGRGDKIEGEIGNGGTRMRCREGWDGDFFLIWRLDYIMSGSAAVARGGKEGEGKDNSSSVAWGGGCGRG
jgi:hypothetical protein